MQLISKLEQPTSPSSSTSSLTPKTTKDLIQIITQFLERGQQSALQMKTIINNERPGFKVEDGDHGDHQQASFGHHTRVTLDSIESCIFVIKSYDLDHHHVEDDMKKRKLDHQSGNNSDVECSDHFSKSEEISDGGKSYRKRRGCYKRRKSGQTRTVEASNLTDDGYAWRKYGQKEILHTKYPRNYYRCTHKNDQNCQATKQVQQISENPTKFAITYHGDHTCNTILKTPSILIDNTLDENSSSFLSFETKNYHPLAKHAVAPSMFPSSSAFHNNSNPTLVKQKHTPIVKNETPLAPHDLDLDHDYDHDHRSGAHIQNQYSSSSDNHKPSSSSTTLSDLTSTGVPSTPVSEQGDVISSSTTAEFYSNASPYNLDDDELMSLISMDHHCVSFDGLWNNL